MSDVKKERDLAEGLSRRSFFGAGSAVSATARFVELTANAQQRDETRKAEGDHALSNPGQDNSCGKVGSDLEAGSIGLVLHAVMIGCSALC